MSVGRIHPAERRCSMKLKKIKIRKAVPVRLTAAACGTYTTK
jgi:hypothetical protein